MSRRRRRQKRAHSGAGRAWGVVCAVVVLLLVVGFIGGYFWLIRYLRSDAFRELVEEKASAISGAAVAVDRLAWDGMLVRVPRTELVGTELIQFAEVEGLETEIELGGLIRREVRMTPIHVRKAHLEIDVTGRAPEKAKPNKKIEFPGLSVEELSGRLSFGGPELLWQDVRGNVAAGHARGSYQVDLAGGSVVTPIAIFPAGQLETMKARYFGGRLFLTESRFSVYESGWLELGGEIELSRGRYSLEGKLEDIYGREMVPEDWKKRLEGTLRSDFTVRGQGRAAPVISGHLEMIDGVLTGLPLLDRAAAYTDVLRFRRLVLSEARLEFEQRGERLELRDIVLISEGLMRLEGELVVVDRELNGRFELGLTPGTLARIPGAESKVFKPGREGLLWAPVLVRGTLDAPKEDLSKRLIVAAGERMFEMIPETGLRVLRYSERDASEMAQGLLEKGRGALDIGAGVVDQGGNLLGTGVERVGGGLGAFIDQFPLLGSGEAPREEEVPAEDPVGEEDE